MMGLPTVDVVIPTYNRAYCLARAIDSVLAQSHTYCRAIVVDDGSTDSTQGVVQDRYGGNPQVVYVGRVNGGVSAARNTGLARCGGDYVAFLDSDDAWKPWKAALQVECLRALPGVGMIWTDMEAIDSSNTVIHERYLKRMYGAYKRTSTDEVFGNVRILSDAGPISAAHSHGERLYWGDIFSPMISGNLVHTSTVMLTRERAMRVGGFNESLKYSGEDFDFHLRTCREGAVAFADVPSIQYRIGNEDQLTQPAYLVHIARNYLKTIVPIIEQSRNRIALTDRQIQRLIAGAHAWIADEMFEAADFAGARIHAFSSVSHSPLHARPWMVLAASMLPESARNTLLSAFRVVKRELTHRF